MSSRLFIASLALLISSSSFAFTDSLWIVGAEGYPDSLVTVEVWLQYEGGGPGDSIGHFVIPLTYDASVCTAEAITISDNFDWWTDQSRIDNRGTNWPPPVPKIVLYAFTFTIFRHGVPRGTHLAATVDFRILDTTVPPDSTCLDTLMEVFSPPWLLGFGDKNGINLYVPSFSADCIRIIEYPCGDCNGDGRVTIADALYIKNYYYQTPPGSPAPIGQGDVNLDGRITVADALYLKNYYYQTPPGSPSPCEPPLGTSRSEERSDDLRD